MPYARAEELLRDNPVTIQTLGGEQGTPLMVRTIAKAAATLAAAVSSVDELPNVVRPITTWARTTTLAGYRFTRAEARPKWMIGGGFVLLVIGALAAIQHSTVLGWGGLAAASLGAYLVLFGAWQTSSKLLIGVFSTAVVLGIFSLTTPVVRRGLFGTDSTHRGYIGDHVQWLGSTWFHPLIAVGVLALVIALAGYLPAKVTSLRRRRPAGAPASPGSANR